VTETPLFSDPLYGLRFWRVKSDEGGEFLAGPHQRTPWPTGGQWLHAQCPTGHGAPAPGCDCGAHAWHPRRHTVRDVLAPRGTVPGIIEAQGAVEVHEDGIRAARARPYALILTPGCNEAMVRRLADRYGAALVEVRGPRQLLSYCREHQMGIGEDVVAELLGIGDPGPRRRARFRHDALRVAVALLITALLTLLGAELMVDPPGHRTLFGRTGEIHTH
jgi:hypothetical protein